MKPFLTPHPLLIACLLILGSCSVADPGDVSVSRAGFTLGAERQLVSQTIGTGGGTVMIGTSADTLNGLTIDVPPNSYPMSKEFVVSYAPITGTNNIEDVVVLSPMIIIENGGEYSDEPMIVKIPVSVPADMFAMVFAYDETRGGLEGLPIIDLDSGSVTAWTLHFEHSGVHDPPPAKLSTSADGPRRSLLTVIALKKDRIMAANVQTKFRPGVDDWSFRNRGSTISPGGHCAGQTFGMMYYYMDHRLNNEPPLNGRFDNDGGSSTPDLWQDDASAYRFCSFLQKDYRSFLSHTASIERALQVIGKSESFRDSLMFMAFKLGMYVTKAPQFIHIRTVTNDTGHAMLTYAASATGIRICDPNYPGAKTPGYDTREITFSNGRFQPYFSGPDADHLGIPFPTIRYMGLTSSLNWNVARNEWARVAEGTAGLSRFPSFVITARDTATGMFVPLPPGWKSTTGKIEVRLTSSVPTLTVRSLFLLNGTELTPTNGFFSLPDGRNQIGIYVEDIANPRGKWAGFRWFELVGRNAPQEAQCTRSKSWSTLMGSAYVVYNDSGPNGRTVIFEDLSAPEDICADVHIHPTWEVTGNLSGMRVYAKSYWGGLFGDEVLMTGTSTKASATMEIGLKQAFGTKPAWVGLQVKVTFASKGSLEADLAWLAQQNVVSRIRLDYKEHQN